MKKIILITAFVLITSLSRGTLPVIDYSSIAQEIKAGLTQLQQLTQEINSYQTLLLQYKNQLLQATGIASAAQIYSQAQGTLNQITGTVNMYRSGGALQGYIQNATNINYWLSSSASPAQYTAGSSSPANYWSTTQQTANDAMVKEIQQQSTEIQNDAQILQRLQNQAPSIQTDRQAMDAANEIANLEAKSLIEIRTLLVSEQQALAAKNGSAATDDAVRKAATQQYYNVVIAPQDHVGF